ncbi:MAG TPA: YciI family protein [Solirubrobacteraceae bacterium]|jgi:uncharacterized protein
MDDPTPNFVLIYDYVADISERRGPHRAAHLGHANDWKDEGRLISGGALGSPPTGALFVFSVDGPWEVETFVLEDPYVTNDLVTGHRILPWTVVV